MPFWQFGQHGPRDCSLLRGNHLLLRTGVRGVSGHFLSIYFTGLLLVDRQNLVFAVTVLVPNPDAALKAGLPVDATFDASSP